jgi:hypothetical protein
MSAPFVETPMGRIEFVLAVGPVSLDGPSDEVTRDISGIEWYAWRRPPLHARLTIVPFAPELPAGMRTSGAFIALWELRAQAATGPCLLEARWTTDVAIPHGGPSSGQYLNAVAWSQGNLTIALGGPDAAALLRYAAAGIQLPMSWRVAVDVPNPEAVSLEEYTAAGLRLRMPALGAGEVAYLHCAVAWANSADQEEAPWFAVDVSPEALRQCIAQMPCAR